MGTIQTRTCSCEHENLGWDLTARRGRAIPRAEVKGSLARVRSIELTPNEYAALQEFGETYRIFVVDFALHRSNRRVKEYRQVRADIWKSQYGTTLSVEPLTGARLTAIRGGDRAPSGAPTARWISMAFAGSTFVYIP